jgi:ribosomal protein S18 acetylase RimI-like enzyme
MWTNLCTACGYDVGMFTIRRLGPGDEAVLALLARDEADFDLEGRDPPAREIDPAGAAAYLADPAVHHWIAEEGAVVLGHLYAHVLRKRAGESEVLLYEIGVRAAHRRRGVGRALVAALRALAGERELWVLADNPGATAFYEACGFAVAGEQPVYLTID